MSEKRLHRRNLKYTSKECAIIHPSGCNCVLRRHLAGSAYASGERLYCEYDHHTKFYPDKKELDSVYKKANRPGFWKKKYREEHAAEPEERNKVNKYLKTNHIDEADVKSLKLEYENLKFDLEKTARALEEAKKRNAGNERY